MIISLFGARRESIAKIQGLSFGKSISYFGESCGELWEIFGQDYADLVRKGIRPRAQG
jgi:hypothetical protein